jgi:hypothetical protein
MAINNEKMKYQYERNNIMAKWRNGMAMAA